MDSEAKQNEKLWHSVKAVPHSSIVGGGTMLLAKNGQCVGQIMLLNVQDKRKEFEAEVTRRLATYDQLLMALGEIFELTFDGAGIPPEKARVKIRNLSEGALSNGSAS